MFATIGIVILFAYTIRLAVRMNRYVGALERFHHEQDPLGYRMLCAKLGITPEKKYR